MTEEQLTALQVRVQKGIEWMLEHDPTSAFHAWFTAGLTKTSPMPAQDDETQERWRAYYDARVLWEMLERKLAAAERRLPGYPQSLFAGWKPRNAR